MRWTNSCFLTYKFIRMNASVGPYFTKIIKLFNLRVMILNNPTI